MCVCAGTNAKDAKALWTLIWFKFVKKFKFFQTQNKVNGRNKSDRLLTKFLFFLFFALTTAVAAGLIWFLVQTFASLETTGSAVLTSSQWFLLCRQQSLSCAA